MDDKELDSTVEDGSEGGTADGGKHPKKKYILAGLGIACVIALACGGIYAATSQQKDAPVAEQSDGKEEAQATLSVGAKAEGWDAATSTPVIAHIVNEGEGIDFYHAYNANEPEFLNAEADSGFEVSFISPVNADGSIYKVPETAGIEVGDGEDADEVPFTFERVDAEDVSADELTALVASIAEAVKGGDETLMGENGVKVAELLEKNAASNANADEESIAQQAEAVETAAEQSVQSQQASGGKAPSGGSKGGSSGSAAASGGNSGSGSTKPSGGSSSSGNNGGGSGSGSSTSKPSHTHSWVAQTKTVNHPAEYKTVHHDAVTKTVHICNGCGADITGNESSHLKNSALNGGTCESWHGETRTVQNAYDEKVLVKDAWSETVTTGYVCSGCGVSK